MRSICSLVLLASVAHADPDPWGSDAKRPPPDPPPRGFRELTDAPEAKPADIDIEWHETHVRFHTQLGDWHGDKHDTHVDISPTWHDAQIKITLSVTCQGDCDDPAKFPSRIAASARDDFSAVKSFLHSPPRWITKPHTEKSGAWVWRFQGADKKVENTFGEFGIALLVKGQPFFVSCEAQILDRVPWAWLDRLEKICREMTFEVVAP